METPVHTICFTESAPFTFTGKERDSETGFSYYGARYYDPELSALFLSVDPCADKYPGISPYAYCAWNPVKLVDLDGEEFGDYYDKNGRWLGTDGKNDNMAYVAKSVTKNSKGLVESAVGAQKLSITNDEILDRATWVCGESGGSGEYITNRTQNAGDVSSVANARVVDYLITLLLLLVCSLESVAQTFLNNLPCVREFQVVYEDTVSRKTHILDNVFWIDSIFALPQEYPIIGLISQRSYIVSDTHKYMLDSLIIKNYNEYCLALDISGVYIVAEEKQKYLIIECYNTLQFGSDSQPVF